MPGTSGSGAVDVGRPAAVDLAAAEEGELVALFRSDAATWDGRYAHNAWLQDVLPPGHVNLSSSGGHLGNAWNPELRSLVLGELKARLEGREVSAKDAERLDAFINGTAGPGG